MEKKLLIVFIFATLIIAFSSLSFVDNSIFPSYQNVPDGFRGIKWGTHIKDLKDMVHSKSASTVIQKNLGADFEVYKRKNDKMSIGKATLEGVFYIFCEIKFFGVGIRAKGKINFERLKSIFCNYSAKKN